MDIDTMEQKGRRRKSPAAHDMPRRLVGSKCVDQRVPVYRDQTVPVWPFAKSPAATKLPARNFDAATESSNLHCCCINSSRTPQCNTASSFQLVPSASPTGPMIFEDQSARVSNSAVCSSNSSNNNNSIFDPPASTSTSELHEVRHPTILLIRSWKWIPGVASNIPCTTVVSKSLSMLPMHWWVNGLDIHREESGPSGWRAAGAASHPPTLSAYARNLGIMDDMLSPWIVKSLVSLLLLDEWSVMDWWFVISQRGATCWNMLGKTEREGIEWTPLIPIMRNKRFSLLNGVLRTN